MNPIQEGLDVIYNAMIKGLLQYLHEGIFPNNSPGAYMIAYSAVHKLADETYESSELLLKYYHDIITDYLQTVLLKIKITNDEQFIDDFLSENEKCNILIYWMKRIFTYLDKFYMKEREEKSLSSLGLKLYKNIVFLPLKDKLFTSVNKLIKEDRDCNVVYRFKIKNTFQITEELDIANPQIIKENDKILWTGKSNQENLKNWFDDYFMAETKEYAIKKGKIEIQNMSAPEYINSALKYLDEENQRKNEYINNIFWKRLDEINAEYLVEKNALTLAKAATGIATMFKNQRETELQKAFMLICKHPNSIKVLTEEFDPYIRERGNELGQNKDLIKDPIKFIPRLIALKKEMDLLVQHCFDKNINCQDSKNKAFSHFMSKEIYSKQLANYIDYLMKGGFKAKNEQQIDESINEIISLFKCLSNKLIFQTEACKRLSDRLISNKSLSLQAEKNIIQKLKAEAGVTYVNKMTSMMDDLESGKRTIDQYRTTSRSKGAPNGILLQCQVVQQGSWDITKSKFDKVEIPANIQYCIDDFLKFYLSKHKEHKLQWCYGLGTLEIKYLYLSKGYISVSTLIQYAVLYNLEKYGKITVDKLSSLLGYNNMLILISEVTGLIFHPSFNPGKKLGGGVIKTSLKDKEEMNNETEIDINKEFVCNNLKIQTLPLAMKKSSGENQQQDQTDAINLKNYQNILIDANITRIMKSRINIKTTHGWLVTEVVKQIELFQAQPPQIKERIEALIEKQIIKRNEKDRNCYEYLA